MRAAWSVRSKRWAGKGVYYTPRAIYTYCSPYSIYIVAEREFARGHLPHADERSILFSLLQFLNNFIAHNDQIFSNLIRIS